MTVDVLYNSSPFNHIVITPTMSHTTYVVTVNEYSGRPFFTGIPLVDVFPDHKMALQQISDKYKPSVRHSAVGLIGMAKDLNSVAIGLIDDVDFTGYMPGGHLVKTVRSVKYVTIPNDSKTSFSQFQLNNNHFFCDDYDITRLFPSNHSVHDSDNDFVWNAEWIKPFEEIGLGHLCVKLLEGACLSSSFPGRDFSITYMLRRSRANPGTRYNARGLNKNNEPGNEVECELIFSRGDDFSTHFWRRGSAPIKWETKIQTSIGKPLHIPKENFFEGTADYFWKLRKRFGEKPIRIVSMLESGPNKSENEVFEAFKKAVSMLDNVGIKDVSFYPFDVNHELHTIGAIETKNKFNQLVDPFFQNGIFNTGTLPSTITSEQSSLQRFNCADSLDRVNIVTFFYSLILTEKWLGESLPQDVIDFLAKAFVISGNIVSLLYTNTQAIKIKHIKAFSPNINLDLSDSTVTIQRRIQNIAFDNSRNKIIYDFVNPIEIPRKIVIDPDHIFNLSKNFPRSLFELQITEAVIHIQDGSELLISLPRPMIVSKFSIHNCNAKDILVMAGMTPDNLNVIGNFTLPATRKWCRFYLDDADLLGVENYNHFLSQFVRVRFFSEHPQFTCGNIRLECQLPRKNEQVNTWHPKVDEESLQKFTSLFEDFLKSQRTLKDLLKLEKDRLSLFISEDIRNEMAVKHGINPILCDSYNTILNLSVPSNPDQQTNQQLKFEGCHFCGKSNVTQTSYYSQSLSFKGLIKDFEENDEYYLASCKDCEEFADNIAALSRLFNSEYLKPMNVPHFEVLHTIPEKVNGISEIGFPSTATFYTPENNMLLTSEGGNVEIHGKREFRIFFFKNSIISNINITCSSTNIKLLFENKEISKTKLDDNSLSFLFTEQPIAHLLNFTIECESQEEIITIQKIKFFGVFINDEIQEVDKTKKQKIIPEVSGYGYEWNEANRTVTFKFVEKKILSKLGILINKSPTNSIAQSLLFIFYSDSEIVGTTHLILPRVKEGTNLWYPLNVESFNHLEVYYLDRSKFIRPHTIGFKFE